MDNEYLIDLSRRVSASISGLIELKKEIDKVLAGEDHRCHKCLNGKVRKLNGGGGLPWIVTGKQIFIVHFS